MSKLGFFGGSFNPPTIAHKEIVNQAIKEFNLEKLFIIPMGDKYEKKDLITFEHRYKMLEKMFEENPKVEISKMQDKQLKRSYAIDSFNIIDEKYQNYERFYIMGLDNFSNISKWKNSDELTKNHKFIIFKRNNIDVKDDFKGVICKDIFFFDVDLNISSTMARQKIREKENLENILTKEIIEYIHKNELYE